MGSRVKLEPHMREMMQALIDRTAAGQIKWTRDGLDSYECRTKDGGSVNVNVGRIVVRDSSGEIVDHAKVPGVQIGEVHQFTRMLVDTIIQPRSGPSAPQRAPTPRTGLVWRFMRWLFGR